MLFQQRPTPSFFQLFDLLLQLMPLGFPSNWRYYPRPGKVVEIAASACYKGIDMREKPKQAKSEQKFVPETKGEDFHSAPVPILMSVRYSNGMLFQSRGRALFYNSSSLRVLSPEPFEEGILVNVSAPFLKGITSCSVSSTLRTPERPGYFELDLRFVTNPVPVPGIKGIKENAEKDSPPFPIPKGVTLAAQQFASRLEQSSTLRFSQVLQEIQPAQRPLFQAVSAIAVMLLLQDKAALDLRRLLTLESIGTEH